MINRTQAGVFAVILAVGLLGGCWPCPDCPKCPDPPAKSSDTYGDQGMIKIKVTPGGTSTIDYLSTLNTSVATGPGGIISEEYAVGTAAGKPSLQAGTWDAGNSACTITNSAPLFVKYTLAAAGQSPERRIKLRRIDSNSQRLDWFVNGIRIQTLCRAPSECNGGPIPAELAGAIVGNTLRACQNEADCDGTSTSYDYECATINP